MPRLKPSINEIQKYIQKEHGRTKRHANDLAHRVFTEPARSLALMPFEWHAALHPQFVIAPELRRSIGLSDPTGNTAVQNVMKQKNGPDALSPNICIEAVEPNTHERV